jgi:hypothetical protein
VPAISFAQILGSATVGQFANSATITNQGQAVTVGNTVFVQIATVQFDPTQPVTVTDSGGNFYSQDVDVKSAANNPRSLIFSTIATNALAAGGNITVSLAAAAGNAITAVTATEFTGRLVVDRTSGNTGTSTTPSSGAAAPTSTANELLLGGIAVDAININNAPPSTSFTPGVGFTQLDSPTGTSAINERIDLKTEFRIVSNIGAFQADGTIGSNRAWAAALATYKEVLPLTATPITATVAANSTNNPINVLISNTDPAGGTLSITAITAPARGTAALLPGNTGIVYTPAANFFGTDTFTYNIQSSKGGTATGTITVTVTPPLPSAAPDRATVKAGSASNAIKVLANDTDPGAGTLSIQSVGTARHGRVALGAGGTLLYTPARGFFGTDLFTYTIASSNGGSSTNTVTVTVTPTLSLTAPKLLLGSRGVLSFRRSRIAVVATNARASIRLVISTSAGKLRVPLRLAGLKVKGANSRTLTLTGTQSALNKAIAQLTLNLDRAGARAQLRLTATARALSARAALSVRG